MFDLYDKNGGVIHQSKSFRGIRRFVKKDNVDHVALAGTKLLISFKDGRYMLVSYPTRETRDASLARWRNLKGVKRVEE
jgi:hypothetical protein